MIALTGFIIAMDVIEMENILRFLPDIQSINACEHGKIKVSKICVKLNHGVLVILFSFLHSLQAVFLVRMQWTWLWTVYAPVWRGLACSLPQ